MNNIEQFETDRWAAADKDYSESQDDIPEHILRVFDRATLRTNGGDVFGRIYEYFLMNRGMHAYATDAASSNSRS